MARREIAGLLVAGTLLMGLGSSQASPTAKSVSFSGTQTSSATASVQVGIDVVWVPRVYPKIYPDDVFAVIECKVHATTVAIWARVDGCYMTSSNGTTIYGGKSIQFPGTDARSFARGYIHYGGWYGCVTATVKSLSSTVSGTACGPARDLVP